MLVIDTDLVERLPDATTLPDLIARQAHQHGHVAIRAASGISFGPKCRALAYDPPGFALGVLGVNYELFF